MAPLTEEDRKFLIQMLKMLDGLKRLLHRLLDTQRERTVRDGTDTTEGTGRTT